MAETIRVSSEQTNLEVNAGEAVDTVITVQNLGAAVGVFTIDINGLDPTWFSLSGNSVSLFPGDSTAITLVVVPPRMGTSLAKDYPFTIEVSSQRDEEIVESLPFSLKINAFYDFLIDYQPQRARGASVQHTLSISNTGNAELKFDLEARDTDGLCTFEFDPESPVVGPSQTTIVAVTAKGKRPLRGMAPLYQYEITATPSNGEAEPKSSFAQLEVPPRIPSWTIRAATFTVIAVIIGVAVFVALNAFLWAPVEVDQLKVATGFVTLTEGKTSQLTAISVDGSGEILPDQPVTWTSTNPEVVTVSATGGRVQALKPGTAIITPALQNQELDSSKVVGASVTVLQPILSTDCVSYDPDTIRFGVSSDSRLVITDAQGNEVLTLLRDDDQVNAMRLASKNRERCFIGRDSAISEHEVSEIEFWLSRSGAGQNTGDISPEDCDSYNASTTVIRNTPVGEWILVDNDSLRIVMDDQEDAEAALQLARSHSSRCFVGRVFVDGSEQGYLTQYWK